MKTITLTNEKAMRLLTYLKITTNYRVNEMMACQALAAERREDGRPKYPNAENNAKWWKETIDLLAGIGTLLEETPYE